MLVQRMQRAGFGAIILRFERTSALLIKNRLRDYVDMFWSLYSSTAYYSIFFKYSWLFCSNRKTLIYVVIMTAKLLCEVRIGLIWRHITHRNYSSTNRHS